MLRLWDLRRHLEVWDWEERGDGGWHIPGRKGLRLCNARSGGDRGNANGQLQKMPTKQVHDHTPLARGFALSSCRRSVGDDDYAIRSRAACDGAGIIVDSPATTAAIGAAVSSS